MRIFLLVWEHCSSTVSCITMISHWRESAPQPRPRLAPAPPGRVTSRGPAAACGRRRGWGWACGCGPAPCAPPRPSPPPPSPCAPAHMVTAVLPVCCPHLHPGVVGPEQLGYPGGRGGGAGPGARPRARPPVGVVQPGQRSGDRLLLLQPSGAM